MSKDRAKNRPQRTPLTHQKALNINDELKHPDFAYRVVNEEEGRIASFLKAGWEPVSGAQDKNDTKVQDASQMGSVVRRVVNKDPAANAKTGILMRKPKEWFEEDMAEKQLRNDMIEASYNPEKALEDGQHYGAEFEKKIN